MNVKEAAFGMAAGLLLGAGGSQMLAPEKIELKQFGIDRVWEQSYNGTDGSDPSKVWYVSNRASDGAELPTLIIPKSMVKEEAR